MEVEETVSDGVSFSIISATFVNMALAHAGVEGITAYEDETGLHLTGDISGNVINKLINGIVMAYTKYYVLESHVNCGHNV